MVKTKDDCLFCKIVKGDIPSEKIYEDDLVIGFNDINPVAPTHILIIPKDHFSSLNDFEAEDTKLLGEVVYRAKQIAKTLNLEDYRLVTNTGAKAGQSVFHLHFHLIAGRDLNWPPG